MKERRKYKHEAPSAETVKRRATERGGGYDSYLDPKIPKYKSDDGENRIRIIPCARIDGEPWGDKAKWEDSWGIKIHVHFGIGTDRGSYLCPKRMGVGDCPICESIAEIALEDEDKAKKLRPNARSLCYLIDRSDEKAGPQAWSMPWTKMEQQIQKLSNDPDTGAIIDVSNPEDGYDIIFTKSGKEERTDYGGIAIARKASPLCRNEDTQDEWMEYIHENPLPGILKFYDYKYMEKVFMGKAGSKDKKEDEDDRDDKKDSRRRSEPDDDDDRSSRRRASSKDEPDDDDKSTRRRSSRDDDDDGKDTRRSRSSKEDEEETDTRSSRRSSRDEPDDDDKSTRRRSSRDDKEDDDDARPSRRASKDDDDDTGRSSRRSSKDDDEPPARSSRRSSKDDDDNEPPPKSSRRASRDEPDDDDKSTRRRSSKDDDDDRSSRRRSSKEDEDEVPFEEEPEDDGKDKKTTRRSSKDDDEPRASTKAKAGLDNLKRRQGKGDD